MVLKKNALDRNELALHPMHISMSMIEWDRKKVVVVGTCSFCSRSLEGGSVL